MKISDEKAFYAVLAADFLEFVKMAFREINPGTQYLHNWHIDAILYLLECARRGESPRTILNVAPRSLKSFLVSIAWPAFILGHDPAARVICVSYSDELGESIAAGFRKIVTSEWYRRTFPLMKVAKNTATEVSTDMSGGRIAISVGGSLTGRGGDIIIIDDPIKPEDANSDKARERVNQWFINTLLSRLNDKSLGLIVLVMQRLHVGDLTGYLQDLGGFNKLSLPAIATETVLVPTGPGPADVYRREKGEVLHADRDDLAAWERIRDQVGLRMFNAQYQQAPEAPEGNIFKMKHLKFFDKKVTRHPRGRLWISIDTAMSTSDSADYTAVTVGYSRPEGHFIIRAHRGRWEYEDVKQIAMKLWNEYRDLNVQFLIEFANVGISLTQYLKSQGAHVMTHSAKHDKVARAYNVIRAFDEGRVFIARSPKYNEGLDCLVNELMMFPRSRYDDQVDSLVQGLTLAEPWVDPKRQTTVWVQEREPRFDLSALF